MKMTDTSFSDGKSASHRGAFHVKLEKWRTTEGVYIKSGQKRNIDDATQNLCQAEIILQNFFIKI